MIFLLDQYFEFVMCFVWWCHMVVVFSNFYHVVAVWSFHRASDWHCLNVDIVWAIPKASCIMCELMWIPLSEYEFLERANSRIRRKNSHLIFHLRAPFYLFFSFFLPFIGTFDLLIFDRNCFIFDFKKRGEKNWQQKRKKKSAKKRNGRRKWDNFHCYVPSFIQTATYVLTKVR